MAQKTLLNYCQGTLEQGSVLSMEQATPIVNAMPVKQVKGNSYSFNVVDTLLSTEHRELGDEVIAGELQSTKVTKELSILTNRAKVDRALAVMADITDLKAESQHLAMVSSGKALEKKVILELKQYLADGKAGKYFAGATSTDLIDDAVDFVGKATLIFVNPKGQRELKKLLKAEGQMPETVESFGKRVIAYDTIPVHVSHDLADDEMLVVKFDETGVMMATNGGLRVYEHEAGVFQYTDTELLYAIICTTTSAFASVQFTKAARSK